MDIIKIIFPTVLTFFIGIFITPFFSRYFYRYKMWKKSSRTNADTSEAFKSIHNTEHELSTPKIGGVIIWVSVLFTVCIIYLLSIIWPSDVTLKLNLFSRSQTLVPLGTFFFAAFVGLADDLLHIYGHSKFAQDALIYRKIKIFLVTLIGFVISFWFYYKLDFSSVHIPFNGSWELGVWFIPFFIIVMLATFSTSVIAFINNQIDIAALSGAIAGGILAFLWFNIPPARFYMGETGMMALTVVLAVIAFLTDSVLILPIIALPLAATTASDIIQIYVYKFFHGYRVFRVAPLHHHFQALGWPREKVVMRYWVVSVISAIIGVILVLIS